MISHKHRCIFVHIPKCGGQSVEHVFVRENGLTWGTRGPLLLRPNGDPRRGPPRLAHLTWQEYIDLGYISAALVRKYTTFTVVRDPFKRTESLYRFLGYDAAIPFERFVTEVLTRQIIERGDKYWFVRPQYEYICDVDTAVQVDRIVKLERIDEQLPPLLRNMGVSNLTVPYVNQTAGRGALSTIRVRFRHARRGTYTFSPTVNSEPVWNRKTQTTIHSLYERDFELFGY